MGSPIPLPQGDGAVAQALRASQHLRIHAINIYVRDQERSLRFFCDTLGFDLAFDARLQSGQRWVAVAPPDGTALLTLIAPEPDSEACKLIGRPTQKVESGKWKGNHKSLKQRQI